MEGGGQRTGLIRSFLVTLKLTTFTYADFAEDKLIFEIPFKTELVEDISVVTNIKKIYSLETCTYNALMATRL